MVRLGEVPPEDYETLRKAFDGFEFTAAALAPGGVLVVEPWFTPSAWKPGTVHGLLAEQPGLRIARVSV